MEKDKSFLNAIKEAPRILPTTADEWRGGLLWECSIYWVYKLKWGGKRYRIPINNKKLIKAVEPHGTAMFRILNLCEQCHPFQEYGYASGLKWFCHIVHIDLIPQSFSHTQPKTDRVSDGRDQIKKLRKKENPFSESDEPHLWRSIEQSIKMMRPGSQEKVFPEDYWRPFIKSYSKWLSTIESPEWKSVIVEGNYFKIRPDRGNGTIKIDPCKNANLEALSDKGYSL